MVRLGSKWISHIQSAVNHENTFRLANKLTKISRYSGLSLRLLHNKHSRENDRASSKFRTTAALSIINILYDVVLRHTCHGRVTKISNYPRKVGENGACADSLYQALF